MVPDLHKRESKKQKIGLNQNARNCSKWMKHFISLKIKTSKIGISKRNITKTKFALRKPRERKYNYFFNEDSTGK